MPPSLPTEVLVEIFSCTDYLTLKVSIRSSSRDFRDIVDHAASRRLDPLRYALFRDKLTIPPSLSSSTYNYNIPYDFHPALSLLRVRPRTGQTEIQPPFGIFNIGFHTANGFLPLINCAVAFEHVTSPASNGICWNLDPSLNLKKENEIWNGPYSTSNKDRAVTVIQLVGKIDSALEKYVRDGHKVKKNVYQLLRGWSWEKEDRKLFENIKIKGMKESMRPLLSFRF